MEKNKGLEEVIPGLLDKAISLMERKGRAIKLYSNRNGDSYIVFSEGEGIQGYRKDTSSNGEPGTDWKDVTREDFLDWVAEQPSPVQERVHQNLQDYICTETPKERGEVEFPESEYLFGY